MDLATAKQQYIFFAPLAAPSGATSTLDELFRKNPSPSLDQLIADESFSYELYAKKNYRLTH